MWDPSSLHFFIYFAGYVKPTLILSRIFGLDKRQTAEGRLSEHTCVLIFLRGFSLFPSSKFPALEMTLESQMSRISISTRHFKDVKALMTQRGLIPPHGSMGGGGSSTNSTSTPPHLILGPGRVFGPWDGASDSLQVSWEPKKTS